MLVVFHMILPNGMHAAASNHAACSFDMRFASAILCQACVEDFSLFGRLKGLLPPAAVDSTGLEVNSASVVTQNPKAETLHPQPKQASELHTPRSKPRADFTPHDPKTPNAYTLMLQNSPSPKPRKKAYSPQKPPPKMGGRRGRSLNQLVEELRSGKWPVLDTSFLRLRCSRHGRRWV